MAQLTTATDVLEKYAIRRTGCRKDILEEFMGVGHALSQPDLERSIGEDYDRVTIYRTLTLFLDKGIIHKVLDDTGAMKYALCPDTCSEHGHKHEHVHFKCVQCGNTNCLEDLEVPDFQLPSGYQLQESNLLLSGVCDVCSAN